MKNLGKFLYFFSFQKITKYRKFPRFFNPRKILQKYLPKQLDEQEVKQIISNEIAISKVTSKKDMGKVMLVLKDKLQGKADMAKVSQIVKNSLN